MPTSQLPLPPAGETGLVIRRSFRHAADLWRSAVQTARAAGWDVTASESRLEVRYPNGARILFLGTEPPEVLRGRRPDWVAAPDRQIAVEFQRRGARSISLAELPL